LQAAVAQALGPPFRRGTPSEPRQPPLAARLTLCKSLQHSQIPLRRGIFSRNFIPDLLTNCTPMRYRNTARRLRIPAKSHAEQDT